MSTTDDGNVLWNFIFILLSQLSIPFLDHNILRNLEYRAIF